ncbi:hypothetical protein MRX96_016106 [Rhipicephalus microplus]
MKDDAASNCPADHTDDNDTGGCWKTAIKKRSAHKMIAHKESQTSESIPGVSQRNVHKHSGNRHLPRLPIHDEKIILGPRGGLCLDKWTHPELPGALWSTAGLTTKDREDIILRDHQHVPLISEHQHAPVTCIRSVVQGVGAEIR